MINSPNVQWNIWNKPGMLRSEIERNKIKSFVTDLEDDRGTPRRQEANPCRNSIVSSNHYEQ